MAKFNAKNTEKTTTRQGFPAYRMEEREQLVTAVLTTMLGEPKFYGTTDCEIVILASRTAREDPAFLCRLACYARNEANLRSVSHLLCCVIAREGREFTRPAVRNIVQRPDDITEIMSCWLKMYGKPFPNALKREIANVIQKFDEYGLAKYSGRGKSMKFRDVLRITHPKPKDPETEALFHKVLTGTLETPYTWETELSARGNSAEVWNELVASGRMGYMALLRNLRNILRSGADAAPALEVLGDPERVRESRQMPFRFYSAYRMLDRDGLVTPEVYETLEKALLVSIENMETIPGRTLIAVDVSGSMHHKLSRWSDASCRDIACLMGVMAGRICEDADVCWFDQHGRWSCLPDEKGYEVRHCEKDDDILKTCMSMPSRGGGTEMALPMTYALREDPLAADRPYDRVIYLSDNQCNSYGGMIQTVQGYVDEYRKQFNPDFWVHAVDLQGYGTQQFRGERFNLIAGWSENVPEFILLAENGIGSLVKVIEEYPIGGKRETADGGEYNT